MCKKEELVTLEISIHDLEYLNHVLSWRLDDLVREHQIIPYYEQKLVLSQKLDEFIHKYYEKD